MRPGWPGPKIDLRALSAADAISPAAQLLRNRRSVRDFDNRHPITGEPLTPRTKADRRILYDFTFDAPKSVSLAYELGGDERILDAFRGAVQDTMADMERAMMASGLLS